MSEIIGRRYAEFLAKDEQAKDVENFRANNIQRAHIPTAALHQLCRLLLQNAAVDDGLTLRKIRDQAWGMPYMQNLIMVAATQAEFVWHHASKRISTDIQKMIWESKQPGGDIEQGRRVALGQLDVAYFDYYDHQTFCQWSVDEAIPKGTTEYAAFEAISTGNPKDSKIPHKEGPQQRPNAPDGATAKARPPHKYHRRSLNPHYTTQGSRPTKSADELRSQ